MTSLLKLNLSDNTSLRGIGARLLFESLASNTTLVDLELKGVVSHCRSAAAAAAISLTCRWVPSL